MLCEICKKQFDTCRKLARHIKDYHKITTKQYFDLYLATNDNNHLCPICNKETKFINLSLGYHKTCSHSCRTILQNTTYSSTEFEKINNKRKNTWNNKDLTKYKQLQSTIQKNRWNNYSEKERLNIKEKQKNGFLNMSSEDKEKHSKHISNSVKNRMNNLSKTQMDDFKKKVSNGLKKYYNNMSDEEKRLFRQSCKDRQNNIPEEKKKLMHKRQSETLKNKSKEEWANIKQKEYHTKQQNNSFNTSKSEDNCYNLLLTKFNTINRNYKTTNYPFRCDFYIPEIDLFIECNFHWTHGGMKYDGRKTKCKQQLQQWTEKAKTSQYFKNAIYTWTKRDIQKFKIAKKHKLNYLTFYTEKDFISWFETI